MQRDAVIGAAMVGDDGHRGWLYYVGVATQHQGHGVGKALVRASEEWLHARGQSRVRLLVRKTNSAVVDFYSRLGFEDQSCLTLGHNSE
jgi:ribosomal protein S18 acetylase RimI-like enzyme